MQNTRRPAKPSGSNNPGCLFWGNLLVLVGLFFPDVREALEEFDQEEIAAFYSSALVIIFGARKFYKQYKTRRNTDPDAGEPLPGAPALTQTYHADTNETKGITDKEETRK